MEPAPKSGPPDKETIDFVQGRLVTLLSEEVGFGERLDSRATWLAGFCGLLLSLSVAVRRLVADLAALDQPAQDIAFVGGIGSLVLAVVIATGSTLRSAYWRTTIIEVGVWRLSSHRPKSVIQARDAEQLYQAVAASREANDLKLRLLRFATGLLLLGVGTSAATALIGVL